MPEHERRGGCLCGDLHRYTTPSQGSGKDVHIHVCAACGTKLYLSFARFPSVVGLYLGTLDNPASIQATPENAYCIDLDEAQAGVIIPAGLKTYRRRATTTAGEPETPTVYDAPHIIS